MKHFIKSMINVSKTLTLSLIIATLTAVGHGAINDTSMGGGAKSLGLGEGGGAAMSGAESLFWNPAGVAREHDAEVVVGHTAWIADLNQEAGAVQLPLGPLGVIGASGSWKTLSGIEERDSSGALTKNFSLTTGNGAVSWAHTAGDVLSYGVSAGFLIQNGVSVKETSAPIGAGISAGFGSLRVGTAVTEIGMPQTGWQLSTGWITNAGPVGLDFSAGVIIRKGENRAGGGLEAVLGGPFRVRAGYIASLETNSLSGFNNLSLGVGVKYRSLDIDYAFLPLGDLGQAHRIQISMRFQGESPKQASNTGSATANNQSAEQIGSLVPEKPVKEVEMEFVVPGKTATSGK